MDAYDPLVNPKNLPSHRLAERLAQRNSRQVVCDMQQGEIAALTEDKEALRTKINQQAARLSVLQGSLEEARGVIKRLESSLVEASRGRAVAEHSASKVLLGARAAGWPLPIPLAPPLGDSAPGVVPFFQGLRSP